MRVQRTELHDDLRAIIAAGRELSPEDDALLADMFLARLDRTLDKPRSRRSIAPRNVRRGVSAALLALALLTGGALVSVHGSSHTANSNAVPQSMMKMGPAVKIVPILPPGKGYVVPAIPVPKDVPLQPKG